MNTAIHTDTIERDGYTFRVEHFHDTDNGAPWENEDGHGPVTGWESRDKRPGELVLNSDCGSKRFYDYAEACRIALRDAWGARDAVDGMSKRQIAALAAREDYEHMRAWCNDEWSYIGVVVTLLDVEGNKTTADASVWGVDDNGDYAATVANDLTDEILAMYADEIHSEWPNPATERAVYANGSRSWIVSEVTK